MQTCILNQKLWPFTKTVTTSSWWVYHKEKYHLQKKLKIKRTLTYKAKRKNDTINHLVIYSFIEFCLSSFGQTNNTIYDIWPNFLLPEHMNSHNLLFGCTIVLSTHSNKTIKAIKAFNLYRF